jgi:hypothetical protein
MALTAKEFENMGRWSFGEGQAHIAVLAGMPQPLKHSKIWADEVFCEAQLLE